MRLVGQFGTYGLTIVVEHGNGYYSVYSHLESAAVKLGATDHKGGSDRDGGRAELGLRSAPAFRDPGRESDRAGSDDWLRKVGAAKRAGVSVGGQRGGPPDGPTV